MKKVYVLVMAMIIASASFAQLSVPSIKGATEQSVKTLPYKFNHNADKATVDTAGWTQNFMPVFLEPTAQLHTYILTEGTPSVRIGYWFGTNGTATSDSAMDLWCQAWVNTNTVYVSGVLFWASGKAYVSGSTNSKVKFFIQNVLPYVSGQHGCLIGTSPSTFGPSPAGPVLAEATINTADIDTTFTAFNWVPFPAMAMCAADFAAVADFKAARTNGDTVYMFCDEIGNGLGLDYSQNNVDTNAYYYVSNKLSTLDVNISLLAVIDGGSGIEDEGYFQGMQLTIRNNASSDNVYIDYRLQNNSPVEIHILDMSGKEVAVVNEGTKSANTVHTATLNVSNYAKGMYFVSLASQSGRLTKKLFVE